MTAATIWFGWWLCFAQGGCIPMQSLEVCKKGSAVLSYGILSYCISSETGEHKYK